MAKSDIFAALASVGVEKAFRVAGAKVKGGRSRCLDCGHNSPRAVSLENNRWYCHKCGAGGSVAEVAFIQAGMAPRGELTPERKAVLEGFLRQCGEPLPESVSAPSVVEKPGLTQVQVARAWDQIQSYQNASRSGFRPSEAVTDWLVHYRATGYRRTDVGGVANPGLIPARQKGIMSAVRAGVCAVAPLRSVVDGRIVNLLIRPLLPSVCAPGEMRPWKSATLNWGEGTCRDGLMPLCYGDPVGALDVDVLFLGEGWLDQVTLEWMFSRSNVCHRVLTARCAQDLASLWPAYLRGFKGRRLVLVPHRDKPCKQYPDGAGLWGMLELERQLIEMGCGFQISYIDVWELGDSRVTDVNDCIRRRYDDGTDFDGPRLEPGVVKRGIIWQLGGGKNGTLRS